MKKLRFISIFCIAASTPFISLVYAACEDITKYPDHSNIQLSFINNTNFRLEITALDDDGALKINNFPIYPSPPPRKSLCVSHYKEWLQRVGDEVHAMQRFTVQAIGRDGKHAGFYNGFVNLSIIRLEENGGYNYIRGSNSIYVPVYQIYNDSNQSLRCRIASFNSRSTKKADNHITIIEVNAAKNKK